MSYPPRSSSRSPSHDTVTSANGTVRSIPGASPPATNSTLETAPASASEIGSVAVSRTSFEPQIYFDMLLVTFTPPALPGETVRYAITHKTEDTTVKVKTPTISSPKYTGPFLLQRTLPGNQPDYKTVTFAKFDSNNKIVPQSAISAICILLTEDFRLKALNHAVDCAAKEKGREISEEEKKQYEEEVLKILSHLAVSWQNAKKGEHFNKKVWEEIEETFLPLTVEQKELFRKYQKTAVIYATNRLNMNDKWISEVEDIAENALLQSLRKFDLSRCKEKTNFDSEFEKHLQMRIGSRVSDFLHSANWQSHVNCELKEAIHFSQNPTMTTEEIDRFMRRINMILSFRTMKNVEIAELPHDDDLTEKDLLNTEEYAVLIKSVEEFQDAPQRCGKDIAEREQFEQLAKKFTALLGKFGIVLTKNHFQLRSKDTYTKEFGHGPYYPVSRLLEEFKNLRGIALNVTEDNQYYAIIWAVLRQNGLI